MAYLAWAFLPMPSQRRTEELIQLAACVVINFGTLNDAFIDLAREACQFANALSRR